MLMMFNSLGANGDIYLSSISILPEDNSHAIPWRLGWRRGEDRNRKHHAARSTNASHDDDDEQIDPWRTLVVRPLLKPMKNTSFSSLIALWFESN
jgi:hypothetical protein